MIPAEMRAEPHKTRRLLMSTDECFQAGWDDGARLGERMPPQLIDQMVALHRPYLLEVPEAQDPAA
jgi:hypothetical protein